MWPVEIPTYPRFTELRISPMNRGKKIVNIVNHSWKNIANFVHQSQKKITNVVDGYENIANFVNCKFCHSARGDHRCQHLRKFRISNFRYQSREKSRLSSIGLGKYREISSIVRAKNSEFCQSLMGKKIAKFVNWKRKNRAFHPFIAGENENSVNVYQGKIANFVNRSTETKDANISGYSRVTNFANWSKEKIANFVNQMWKRIPNFVNCSRKKIAIFINRSWKKCKFCLSDVEKSRLSSRYIRKKLRISSIGPRRP